MTTDDLGWTNISTRLLYSATYGRLKNLTLAYHLPLPSGWKQNEYVKDIRVYLTGENLLTFYGHKGMDPEQSIGGTTYYQYPAVRTFSVGAQFGF
jgi:hypothetical protein